MGTYASIPLNEARLSDLRPIGRHPDDEGGPCLDDMIERAECRIWGGSVLNLVELLEGQRAAQQRADHAALLDILDRTARHYVESGALTDHLERERDRLA